MATAKSNSNSNDVTPVTPENAWWVAEHFTGGNLFDKENLIFVDGYFYPHKWPSGKRACFANVLWQPEEGEAKWERYQVGFLTGCVPSNDGVNPAGLSFEEFEALGKGNLNDQITPEKELELQGPFLVKPPTAKVLSMGKDMSFEQLINALNDIHFKDWGNGSLKSLAGNKFYCHRIPQKGSGKKKEGEDTKEYTVLVPAQFLGKVDLKTLGVSSSPGSTSSTSSATPATTSTGEALSTDPETFANQAILAVLRKLPNPVKKTKMVTEVNAMSSDKQFRMSVFNQFINNDEWLGNGDPNREWIFDDTTRELSLIS